VVATGRGYNASIRRGGTMTAAMRSHTHWKQRPSFRRAAVGLVAVAASVAADLATFVGRLDAPRLAMFSLVGLLAVLAFLCQLISKKTEPMFQERECAGQPVSGQGSDPAIPFDKRR